MAIPVHMVLTRVLRGAIDSVLPPQCLACRAAVDRSAHLCSRCWNEIDFVADPVCAACGRPFEYEAEAGTLCGVCLEYHPQYGRARAAVRYQGRARDLLLGFKHGARTERARPMAAWMARAGAALLAEADALAPVPLHRRRLFQRRYNQAAMLALALGQGCGVEVMPDLLIRRRATPTQGGLGRAARYKNVARAFSVRPGQAARIADRALVLVDDVLTSGATAEACTRALLAAGAARVDVLTFAHVMAPRVPG